MSASKFWLVIAVVTGLLWAVLGLAIDGLLAGILLGVGGFIGTLFMAGMVCSGAERQGGDDDNETLEM